MKATELIIAVKRAIEALDRAAQVYELVDHEHEYVKDIGVQVNDLAILAKEL